MPGGHLEHGESIEKAAARELFEETGMTAETLVFNNLMNNPLTDGRHYLQIAFLAVNPKGEPENKEPDKCEGWEWFPLDILPGNLVEFHQANLKAFLENKNFVDSE